MLALKSSQSRLTKVALAAAMFSALPALAVEPQVKTVRWAASDASIAHDTFAYKSVTLKGTSSIAGPNVRATWDFGDGTQPTAFTVLNRYDVSAKHTFFGAPGTQYKATLTVVDSETGDSGSASYLVMMREKTLDTEVNVAIDEGLWALHTAMHRTETAGDWQGDCLACDSAGAANALNLVAFERNGYLDSGDAADPYTETVARALKTLAATPEASRTLRAARAHEKGLDPDTAALLNLTSRLQLLPSADAYVAEVTRGDAADGIARTLVDRQDPGGFWTGNSSAEPSLETARSLGMLIASPSRGAGGTSVTNVSAQVNVTTTGFLFSKITNLYSGTMTVTNNTLSTITGPITVGLVDLTAGVTLANSNGTFNGNPYRTISATDVNAGQSVQAVLQFSNPSKGAIGFTRVTYSGTFPPGALAVTCPTATATTGTAYSSALVGSGGVLAYTFAISAGSLPHNLSLDPATGNITGTPDTVGDISFTGQVTDSAGGMPQVATDATCHINVTSGSPPPVAVNDSYNTTLNTPLSQPAPGVLLNDTLNGGAIFSYGATTGSEQTTIGAVTPTFAGGSIALNADGSFNYTVPSSGFTGADSFKYVLKNGAGTSTATVTINIGKANQTITFTSAAPGAAKVGGPTYTVTATASSGLTVAFTIDATASSVCSIVGSTVSFTTPGTCVIDANQPGDTNYNPAPQAQQSFAVAKGDQTINFTSMAPAAAKVGGPTYTVTATATSGLPVTFTIDASASSVCSISGSTVSFATAGTCVIDANQAGSANYSAAPQAQQSFTVGKGDQTINFTSMAPVGAKVGGPTYTVTATATSGMVVTFTIDASATSVCSISGATVSFIGAGTCKIDANQAGDANYNAAPQAQQSFAVAKGDQTITFTSTAPTGSASEVGGPTYTVTATATSGLAVTFTIDASATSVCSISGATVSFTAPGTCVIDAHQAGDANWNSAPQMQQSFTVNKAPSITSANNTTFAPGKASQTFTVTTTGSPTGASMVISDGGGFPSAVTLTDNHNGTATISGTPASGTADPSGSTPHSRAYLVSITANNGISPNGTQSFTLNITCPSISVTSSPALGNLSLTVGSAMATNTYSETNGNGTAATAWTISGQPAGLSINAASGALTGTPTATGTFSATVTFTDAGGCTGTKAVTITVAPVAVNDSYTGLVDNTQFVVTGGTTLAPGTPSVMTAGKLTANDLPAGGTTVTTTGTFATAMGGSVTIAADGTFLYTPKANPTLAATTADSFNYTISSDTGATGTPTTAQATANLTLSGRVWYVLNNQVTDGNGQSQNSFNKLSDATAAATTNDFIYVYRGDGTTTNLTSVANLKTGQSLIGQGVALVVNASTLVAAGSSPLLGSTVTLNTNTTARGFNLSTGGATGMTAVASITGVTVNTVSVTTGSGTGVDLASTVGTFSFTGLTTTGGAGANLHGINTGATFTFTGVSVSSGINTAFNSTGGGTVNVTGASNTLTSTTGTALNFVNTGGALNFAGLTTTGGAGANLTGNTSGSTFTFTGVSVSSGANAAFTATGGGTLTITGATNTLTSTTGTALNVANTTIGGGGLTFKSISAGTAGSGPVSGIILNNTGASGGLTVVGNSGTSTGGTIQKTTGNAIDLTSTGPISLSWMTIQNSTHLGINGTTLGGFTLANSSVLNNGTTANVDHGIKLLDVSGTATFTSNTVTGNHVTNLFFGGTVSSTTVTNSLTVTGGTYGSSFTNSGIQVGMTHTSTLKTATFTNVTFSSNASTGLQVQSNDNSIVGDGVGAPATGTVTVSGCTFTNNAGNTAIDIDQGGGGGAGQMYARLMNNLTITGNGGPAINIFSSSSATGGTMKVRIDGNHVGNATISGSGSTMGPGIRVFLQGRTTNTITIVNNVVRQTPGSRAIDVEAIGPVATGKPITVSDIVITGNDANTNDQANVSGSLDAIYVAADNQGSPAQINAEIHGNTIPSSTGASGAFDWPTFDGNAPWLYYRIATSGGVAKLFNFGGHANANLEISATQTSGTAGADISGFGGVQLTSTAVNAVP